MYPLIILNISTGRCIHPGNCVEKSTPKTLDVFGKGSLPPKDGEIFFCVASET